MVRGLYYWARDERDPVSAACSLFDDPPSSKQQHAALYFVRPAGKAAAGQNWLEIDCSQHALMYFHLFEPSFLNDDEQNGARAFPCVGSFCAKWFCATRCRRAVA